MLRCARSLMIHAVLALLASAASTARAQSVTISMTADRTQVAVGETFTLQIRAEVSGVEPGDIDAPDLGSFDVLSQQVARPIQFRFGFGNQTQLIQSSTVYTYILRPTRAGTVQLRPARMNVAGRVHQSNPLTIAVGASGSQSGATLQPLDPGAGSYPQQQQQQQQPPQVQPGNGLDGARFDGDGFLRTVVDKAQPYVGEQVTVTVYLYLRGQIRSSPVASREPSTEGFWVHDLLPPTRTLDATEQVVQGVPFRVYVLRRFAAFPLRTGPLTIGPMTVQIQTGSLFDFFGAGGNRSIRRDGVPVTLHAKALPSTGRPRGDIAVGRYEIEARLDRSQAATGDAVTLTATIRGSGNLRDVRIAAPSISGLRFLEPQIRDEISAPGDVVGGARTIQWLVVPERAGTFQIAPLGIDTFDPASSTYDRAEAPPLTLVAAGNAVAAGGSDDDSPAANDPAAAGAEGAQRFGPLRTRSQLLRPGKLIGRETWYMALLALAPLAYLSLLLSDALRRRRAALYAATTSKRAARGARKRLFGAETHAASGDARSFYGEVASAIKTIVEVRLGEPIGGLTHPQLRDRLISRGMPEDLAGRTVDELEGCDFARFSAHGVSREEMSHCLDRARALLVRLDRFEAQGEKVA